MKWEKATTVVELDISENSETVCYMVTLKHSVHYYPFIFGKEPYDCEPADQEIEIDEIVSGFRDGDDMSREELDDFLERYNDELCQKILEAGE